MALTSTVGSKRNTQTVSPTIEDQRDSAREGDATKASLESLLSLHTTHGAATIGAESRGDMMLWPGDKVRRKAEAPVQPRESKQSGRA